MGKADRRLGWAFVWFGAAIATVVGMMIASPIQSPWVIDPLLAFCGISFFLAAYNFGWLKSPHTIGSIGVLPRITLIIAAILALLFWLKVKVAPQVIIEISKNMSLVSIDIAPASEAWIVMLTNDFIVSGTTCMNSGSSFASWTKANPKKPPPWMFTYHVFNHNSYSIRDLRAQLKATFMAPGKSVASRDIDIYIPTLGANQDYSFYVINGSHFAVKIDTPNEMTVQVPGRDRETIPVINGPEITGRFAWSDIKAIRAGAPPIPLDLPLFASIVDWGNNTACPD
jgi:hypothetical protein